MHDDVPVIKIERALQGDWEIKEVSYVTSAKQDPTIFNI